MSINKHFLVVTNEWKELVTPGNRDIFVYNESGKTVHFYLSNKKLEVPINITSEYLALGGTISQSVVRANQYLYAKAACGPDDRVILIADNERISAVEGVELREEIEGIASQLMRLTNRVTDNELKHTDNDVLWTKFLTEYRERVLEEHDRYVALSDMVIDMFKRIYRTETAEAKNTDKIFNMEINTFPDMQINIDEVDARVKDNTARIEQLEAKSK